MKKIGFFIFLLIIIYGTAFPALKLIQPQGGEVLIRGAAYPIKWSAPNSEGLQQVHIYLGEKLIADHRKKKDGFYNWKVGQLKNGTFVSPGHYRIVLESLDGDAFGKEFTIIVPIPLFKIPRLEVFPEPDYCPVCYKMDLRKIKNVIKKTRERFHLKLYKNNRLIADLGEWGGESNVPDFARIRIPRLRQSALTRGGLQCELKLFDAREKLVRTQKVTLVLKNYNLNEVNEK